MNKETMLFGLIVFQSGMMFGMLTRKWNGDKRCKLSTIGIKIYKVFGSFWGILLLCTIFVSFLNTDYIVKAISIINLLLFIMTGIVVLAIGIIEVISCQGPPKKNVHKK